MVFVDKHLGVFVEIDGKDSTKVIETLTTGGVVILGLQPSIAGYTSQMQLTLEQTGIPVTSQEDQIQKMGLLKKLSVFSQDELRTISKFLTLVS